MKLHRIGKDVSGEKYRELLRRLLAISGSFSLVLRDDMGFKPETNALLQSLSTLELRRQRRDRWPGTQTSALKKPLVAYFQSSPEALEPLCAPGSLFSWLNPKYPEDPAFYDHQSVPLFATIAHESESWVLQPVAVSAIAQLVTLEIEDVRDDAVPVIRGEA